MHHEVDSNRPYLPCEWQVVVWYKEHGVSLQDERLYQVYIATRAENRGPATNNKYVYMLCLHNFK